MSLSLSVYSAACG